MNQFAVVTENLTKIYKLYNSPSDRLKETFNLFKKKYHHNFYALNNISLKIEKGKTVGIVGRNGAGKSTLLKILTGVLTPSSGSYHINGKISSLLELGAGFNFDLTGLENIYFNGAVLGYTKKEMEEKIDDIIKFAEIGEFIHQKVKTYSSGMFVRLAFSVAISINPDILIVDEALSVGDELFQRKCFSRIRELKKKGTTIIIVSHGTDILVQLCDEVMLLDNGELLLQGKPKYVIGKYQKLLYADPEKKEILKNEILNSTIQSDIQTEKNEDNINAPISYPKHRSESFFDPLLVSKSSQSYTPNGCHIYDLKLTTLDGKQVNHLVGREKYLFRYKVKFDHEIFNARFGMLIKNITGIELGGKTTDHPDQGLKTVKKNEIYEICFCFQCFLLPGTYFINAGVGGKINGRDTILHRILDALAFKVVMQEKELQTLMIDFNIEHKINSLKNEESV
ncbi:MAG: ABC transporter ATP-binding protein [Desulfobacteraceae bacterium]|nr:ABC transporter ATP-binding protein [Desulfobacteraceae bacterium]MCB9494748.1 ABC transporter ATP-binding protein [Desulfobacteraceae bacterium]